jgi:hypothetical protein
MEHKPGRDVGVRATCDIRVGVGRDFVGARKANAARKN